MTKPKKSPTTPTRTPSDSTKVRRASADRAVAPRIAEKTAQWYDTTFPTINAGATFALEVLPIAYDHALAEMRGRFSLGELSMIADVLNGHGAILCYGSWSVAGQHLRLSIADSFHLHPGMYEQKWEIPDPDDFQARLAINSHFQNVALEIWAAGFWEHHETHTILDWAAPLLWPTAPTPAP